MAENIKEKKARIRNIVDTTENWKAANPILLSGEIGFEITSDKEIKIKIGDGITVWGLLEYITNTPKEIQKQYDALQKEIDNIVIASTDGDGNAAAEVAQARVSEDGTTYETLKARLDEMDEASSLEIERLEAADNDLKKDLNEGIKILEFELERGNIGGQGENLSSTIAVRSKKKIDFDNEKPVFINVPTGWKYTIVLFDTNNDSYEFMNASSDGKIAICPYKKYARFRVKFTKYNSDGSVVDNPDIAELDAMKMYQSNAYGQVLYDNTSSSYELSCSEYRWKNVNFDDDNVETNNGLVVSSPIFNSVSDSEIVITCADDNLFAVVCYLSDGRVVDKSHRLYNKEKAKLNGMDFRIKFYNVFNDEYRQVTPEYIANNAKIDVVKRKTNICDIEKVYETKTFLLERGNFGGKGENIEHQDIIRITDMVRFDNSRPVFISGLPTGWKYTNVLFTNNTEPYEYMSKGTGKVLIYPYKKYGYFRTKFAKYDSDGNRISNPDIEELRNVIIYQSEAFGDKLYDDTSESYGLINSSGLWKNINIDNEYVESTNGLVVSSPLFNSVPNTELSVVFSDKYLYAVVIFVSDNKVIAKSNQIKSGETVSLNGMDFRVKVYRKKNGEFTQITPKDIENNAVFEVTKIKTSENRSGFEVLVAASNATVSEKESAKYICTGVSDELLIQSILNSHEGSVTIKLSNGTYYIDSFTQCDDGVYRAINIPSGNTSFGISIIGQDRQTTELRVTQKCYDELSNEISYEIISSEYSKSLPSQGLTLERLKIQLPNNQKKIICVNLINIGRVNMSRVAVRGFDLELLGITNNSPKMPVAVEGCIGVRMTSGSNLGAENNYTSCGVTGFYEAWQVGGEHVVMINCSGIHNVYSYTFGNYKWFSAFIHPITLINCCDERTVNLPKFCKSGADYDTGTIQPQIQNVHMVDFNIERNPEMTPGGKVEHCAVCDDDYFGGEITFTMLEHLKGIKNSVSTPFFEQGGSNFKVRNIAHKLCGTTVERLSYAANNMQTYYDTDLNKMLVFCNGVWKDFNGQEV